jgi:CheY-like chemotaxis protein
MSSTILLVDDEPMVLRILERILAQLAPDYQLLTVVNGATALSLLAERPVALIITDLSMPDMDGLALTAAIKAVAPLCPVILMTGYATSEIKQRAVAVGVDFFLPKPFPFEQLISMVRAALER